MDIKLWYSKHMRKWRWSLVDSVSHKQESGQQFGLRDVMQDITKTVEQLIEEGYDGEIEKN